MKIRKFHENINRIKEKKRFLPKFSFLKFFAAFKKLCVNEDNIFLDSLESVPVVQSAQESLYNMPLYLRIRILPIAKIIQKMQMFTLQNFYIQKLNFMLKKLQEVIFYI